MFTGKVALRQTGTQSLIAVDATAGVLHTLGVPHKNQPQMLGLACMVSLYMVRIFS